MQVEELLQKYAARNALEHGEAQVDSVVGKVFAEEPDLKQEADHVVSAAGEVVEEINSMSEQELEQIVAEHEYDAGEEDDDGLPELPGAEEGAVVMRMAPFPSGMLHIGNARMAVLNDEYVKRYDGNLILVIDDTAGSEEKKPIQDAYEEIPEDLEWLGVEYDDILYKSDRMEMFHDYAEQFLAEGWAYVCECDAETLRENRKNGVACEHREQPAETNLEKWEKMMAGGYQEGEAAVRLKTDMQADDPAFRDRVLLRISELDHPRVGDEYRVWPMLEFSWAIDDHELGMTHILRGKDLVMEDRMERFMWDLLDWEEPEILHHGLMSIEGVTISTSESRRKIDEGVYAGWDDPRTWSLKSLKKRGFKPEAVRRFVLQFGMSENDVTVPVDTLYKENRDIIDEEADRYFFVEEPHPVQIETEEPLEAHIPRHPEEDRGVRNFTLEPDDGSITVYLSQEDLYDTGETGGELKDETPLTDFIRLKDLCNLELRETEDGVKATVHSTSHEPAIERDADIVQWVADTRKKECEVRMEDGRLVWGYCEQDVPAEVVQFVRFGFVNVVSSGGTVEAYYTHP